MDEMGDFLISIHEISVSLNSITEKYIAVSIIRLKQMTILSPCYLIWSFSPSIRLVGFEILEPNKLSLAQVVSNLSSQQSF